MKQIILKSINKIIPILILLIFASSQKIFSQYSSLSFDRFRIENGLSNNSVNSIAQTNDGFLWVATNDGLNRFNGESFKKFKYNFNDTTSLPENYVMSLLVASDGTLWIGTWGSGLVKFNFAFETFNKIEKNNSDFVQTIFEDKYGNIWYGTENGELKKYNLKNNKIENFKNLFLQQNVIPISHITSIVEDEFGVIWFGTYNSGLYSFNPTTKTIEQFVNDFQNENSILSNGVWNIYKNGNNIFLLSTLNGLDEFNHRTKKFNHSPFSTNKNKGLFKSLTRQTIIDKKGRIWIALYDYVGLLLIEKNNLNQFETHLLKNEDDNLKSISNDRIKFIFEDLKNNIWVATENGLNKLPVTKNFIQYRHYPIRDKSIGGRIVNSLFESDDKILWVGIGGGGFDKIDLKTNIIEHFKNNPKIKNTLVSDDVTAIFEDSEKDIFIGTSNNGFDIYSPKNKIFIHHTIDKNNKNSLINNWVQLFFKTSDEKFLIGTNDGISVFDKKNNSFQTLPEAFGIEEKLFPKKIETNAIFEDKEKNIWIGTWLNGVISINPKTKSVKQFIPNRNKKNSLSSNRVISIYEDSFGNMWFGTYGGGLNKFNKQTESFTNYSIENGFPNDVIFGILEDEEKNLWISTLKGLVRFNPKNNSVRVYDEYDGIVNNQLHLRANFKNKNGNMYFGGMNGFVSFHPKNILVDTVAPNVAITSFKIFNREEKIKSNFISKNKIKIEYSQNFFSIDFAILDLAPTYKHNYAYKLDGYDPDWTYSGTRSTAFYTDVSDGSYNFLVKASNVDGVWSKPIILTIEILPAWWKSIWFKIIIFFLILIFGVTIYQYRIKRLIEIERIRLNISTDLHDEIGSNLSSISIDSQSLMQSNSLTKLDRELISDISKTAKETVDAIRDIIWFINPKNDDKEDINFKMRETAAKLLIGITWDYNVSSDINFELFDLEARRNIYLIYKEALTNVKKHSGAKNCKIEITKNKNNFELVILDDGIGFDISTVKINNGLLNMKFRAKKINGILNFSETNPNGSRIELKIPLNIKI